MRIEVDDLRFSAGGRRILDGVSAVFEGVASMASSAPTEAARPRCFGTSTGSTRRRGTSVWMTGLLMIIPAGNTPVVWR